MARKTERPALVVSAEERQRLARLRDSRMAETAAHLVDHVIPRVPVRQWVLAFPIPLRLLFATHPHLLSPALQIVHRVIGTFRPVPHRGITSL